ncbi:MAG: flagellar biosynthetic protein FliR, partial [Actinobacteria bacterium]|nr:flagellar biosynthetic protein FliR [Actinomycetota bacterium]
TEININAAAKLMSADLSVFFLAAVQTAAPLMAALFLTEITLGLLARAAPHLNIFLLGLPIKLLLTLSLAGLAIPLLPGAVSSVLRPMIRHGLQVVGG